MSSLLGVPMGITEDSISVSLPSNSRHFQNADALQMQVTLCQILAKVDLSKLSILPHNSPKSSFSAD